MVGSYSAGWGLSFFFFRRGWTTACLKQVGTVPVARELLIIERNAGSDSIKDILQESSGDIIKGAGCRFHGRNNLYEGG